MSRIVSLIVLLAIIVVAGLLFYKVMVGFFVPVFLAAVLVVVFRPLHRWVLEKTGYREKISAALTTGLIMLSVLLPTGLVVTSAAIQATGLISQEASTNTDLVLKKVRNSLGLQLDYAEELASCEDKVTKIGNRAREIRSTDESGINESLNSLGNQLLQSLNTLEASVRSKQGPKFTEQFENLRSRAGDLGQPRDMDVGYLEAAANLASEFKALKDEILGGSLMAQLKVLANPTNEQFKELFDQTIAFIRPRLLSFTGATGSFLIHLVIGSVILIVSIFFFLYDGPGMIKALMALSPLDDRYEEELLMEFDKISRAMVLATMLAAMTQGAVAGLGYYVTGVPSLVLLTILTIVFAMVPFVGPPIVWIPVCLYLAFYQDRLGAAIGLAAWGIVVVGTIDNFVKAYVLHGQSQLHPLLALLSVLGGVQALGPIGIVVGPMVVALLQTLLSILQREMLHFEDHTLVVTKPVPPPPQRPARFRLKKKKPKAEQPEGQAPEPVPSAVPSIPSEHAVQSTLPPKEDSSGVRQ